jgi:NADH-quinone oxidoreductase subunit G
MLGRGNSSEIGLYTASVLTSELSSNITDFCPVGALTIKPYALNKRPWEEVYLESIDLSDSLCVPLRVYSNGKKINRILPQYNTDLDLSWITERTRYLSDGLSVQLLDYPCIKVFSSSIQKETTDEESFYFDFFYNENYGVYFFDEKKEFSSKFNSNMMAISWKSIGYFILNKMKNQYGFLCSYYTGEFLDLETMVYIKESALYYGSNCIKSLSEKYLNSSNELVNEDFDFNYLFKLSNFEKYEKVVFVNLNLRLENPILNAKLRQKFIWDNNFKIYYFGAKYNLTYKYIQLGVSTKNLLGMVEGRYSLLNSLKGNKKANLLLYNNNLKLLYKPTFHRALFNYLKNLNHFFEIMYLPKTAASVGSLDISFNRSIVKKKTVNLKRKVNMNYNLFYFICCNDIKVDSFLLNKYKLAHKTFFYQNSHGDNFFNFADYFFPSYSFLEKQSGYYINCFGILKKNRQLVLPRNEFVQDDKDIVKLIHKMVFDINFNSKSYRNKQSNIALYSYIPIYLFAKRRMNFYNILENRITYSSIYFYSYSSKNKNSFKNSILATYSANLNMISYLHFSKKSNLKL